MKKSIILVALVVLIVINVGNKLVEHVTLNVTTIFRTTCDADKVFHYTTGYGSGCSSSYSKMHRCFNTWKANNGVTDCKLLRTKEMSIVNVHLWMDYVFNPKWHHAYVSDDQKKMKKIEAR